VASAGTVEIDFAAETAKFTAELKKVRAQLSDLQGVTKSIAGGFEKAGKVITGVFAGLAVGRAISAVTQATAEAEESSQKLANALSSSGAAADVSLDSLKNYASQLQRTTTVSDEAVQEVESLLLSFRGLSGDTVLRATSAVVDLSARMGIDLRSAAIQVGKALADPEKGLTALAKAGVKLPPALIQTVDLLARTGQQARAQALILKELETSFGGAAAAARNNFGGALLGVKNAFDDLLENKSGAPGATKALNDLADTLNSKETQEGFDHLVTALTKVVELTAKVANSGGAIGEFFAAAAVGGAPRNAIGQLENELQAQQGIIKQLEDHGLFVSREALDLEKARLATLKERLALLKNANAKPIEPVAITQQRVAVAPPDTSAFDVAKRKQELDAALETARAELATTLNEFDALNAKADETQARILTNNTKSTLDGMQAVQAQLNQLVEQDVQHWIESEDLKREATQRSAAARYQIEAQYEQQKRALAAGTVEAGVGLLQSLSTKSKTAAKALILLNRGVAIAQVIQNTIAAASKALAIYGPTPAGFAAAASAEAWGAAQVALLGATAAVEIGGVNAGNAGGIGGSNLGTPSNPLPVVDDSRPGANQGHVISLTVNGNISGPEASQWLIDSIKDLINGNDTIIINGNSRQAAEIRGF
jgi:hypothetical protein